MTEDDDLQVEVLPILPSLSIPETLAFYRDGLGFDEVVHQAEDYLILRRSFAGGRMELHFWQMDDRSLCERTAIYVRGGGIDRLHLEFSERGIARPTPLMLRPWGMEEFYIHDPHGNLIKFGRNAPR